MVEILDLILKFDVGAAGLTIIFLWKSNRRLKELLGQCRSEKDDLYNRFQEYTQEQAKIWRELSTTVKETRQLRGGSDE